MYSSHILCKVDDLAAAVRNWEEAGFSVQLGDAPDKAINALVWFQEGPFIELIDARGARPPAAFAFVMRRLLRARWVERFDRWNAQAEGWCELALETDSSVQPEVSRCKAEGLKVFGPVTNRRTPTNSPEIRTQTAFPEHSDLPILMGAYRPNPRPERVVHRNGAIGVGAIRVELPTAVRPLWHRLLDERECWLEIQPGSTYRVLSVTLDGLNESPPPAKVSGAVLMRGTATSGA